MNKDTLWQACLGELEVTVSKGNFSSWIKDTFIVSIDTDTVVIGTPNAFAINWLGGKFKTDIEHVLSKNLGSLQTVRFVCQKNTGSSDQTSHISLPINQQHISQKNELVDGEPLQLNPRYTFDSFVIGESNRLAHAAALAIAKNPGVTYNPLFLYGGVGLGKTHLMHAIGNEILKNDSKKNIIYTTSERFTNEFISLVRKGKAEKFKNAYRNADVLMIDDIQFLAGKDATQDEFFHTFNALHSRDKQIILSSDRPPKSIAALEARLVSRFEWGMIADINPPDYETRIAILENKVTEKNLKIDRVIIEYIARNIHHNIRELEGALNRVIAHCELLQKSPSIDDVRSLLGESLITGRQKAISPNDVIKKIAHHFEISMDQITGPKRTKELVIPRQIAAYILREELSLSYPKIGKELGGKDHTTIMHACEKIEKNILKDVHIKNEIQVIKEKLYT